MATVRAHAIRRIAAPAAEVYRILADYADQHHRVLPDAFSDYRVEAGGVGEGTVVSFAVTAGGRTRSYTMAVKEPEPGRVLVEADTRSSLVTTFTVTSEGSGCTVDITTTWTGARGVGGFFERRFAPLALRRLYDDELSRLDACATAASS